MKDPLYKDSYLGITPPTFILPFEAPEDTPFSCVQASEGQHEEDEHGEERAKLRFEEQRPRIIVDGKGSSRARA